MKRFRLFLVVIMCMMLCYCSKDQRHSCQRADFIGTFVGELICQDGSMSAMQLEISAGAEMELVSISSTTEGLIYTGKVEGCKIIFDEYREDIFVTEIVVNAQGEIDENQIEIDFESRLETVLETCKFIGRKQ